MSELDPQERIRAFLDSLPEPTETFEEVLALAREEAKAAMEAEWRKPEPNGCRHCGIGEREHASRFAPSVGQHRYEAPTDAQRIDRMTTHPHGISPTCRDQHEEEA